VTEYKFTLKTSGMPTEWLVYDVGGHRSLRSAWAPYFDDMNAIIFLAPISCFDQVLAEDPEVGRLEDSYMLWKSICSNRLLFATNLVLFLNKCDILKSKLDAGAQFADYIPSYGDRPNDFDSVTTCEALRVLVYSCTECVC
jgi:guanine nucleotide-binding protein subunit alpha